MIDTHSEQVLSLSQAAREVPGRKGRGISCSSIWRWCLRGVNGIRLESIVCGSRRYTSREAMSRFFAATTAAVDGDQLEHVPFSAKRQAEIDEAECKLAELGIR